MNNKTKKLKYIRYKNNMRRRGFTQPKWILKTRQGYYKWLNTCPNLLEEAWIIDMRAK